MSYSGPIPSAPEAVSITPDPGSPAFDGAPSQCWVLRKNCSFSPKQVLAFYLSLTTVAFAIAGGFAARGLWMVLPFALVENLALAAALLFYARHALDREHIFLHANMLYVDKLSGPRCTRYRFNPRWVRLEWRGRRNEALWLCQGDTRIPVGIFLTPPRRRRFGHELRKAMRQLRLDA